MAVAAFLTIDTQRSVIDNDNAYMDTMALPLSSRLEIKLSQNKLMVVDKNCLAPGNVRSLSTNSSSSPTVTHARIVPCTPSKCCVAPLSVRDKSVDVTGDAIMCLIDSYTSARAWVSFQARRISFDQGEARTKLARSHKERHNLVAGDAAHERALDLSNAFV